MSKRLVMCTSTGCIEYAPERYRNLGIEIIRVHLNFKGKEYLEGLDLDPEDLYKQMENVSDVKKTLPHTSIPTYEEVAAKFDEAIAKGYDEIICICISSGLGGTYNQIRLIADDYKDKIKATIIDSKITCFIEGYLAIKAKELVDQGVPTETIVKELNWIMKRREFIGIDSRLDYLIFNGRLKGASAFFGKLMSIAPVIHFNENGEIVSLTTGLGERKALHKTCDILKDIIKDRDSKDYLLLHTYTGKHPLDLLKIIEKKEGIKCNHEDVIMSPVSGCHNGPWLAGYLYIPLRREDEPLDD